MGEKDHGEHTGHYRIFNGSDSAGAGAAIIRVFNVAAKVGDRKVPAQRRNQTVELHIKRKAAMLSVDVVPSVVKISQTRATSCHPQPDRIGTYGAPIFGTVSPTQATTARKSGAYALGLSDNEASRDLAAPLPLRAATSKGDPSARNS
jgi:hypothetical protein